MDNRIWLGKKPESILDWICIIFASIGFYLILNNAAYFVGGIGKLLGIISPFAGGIVLAYVLDPLVRFFQKNLLRDNLRWRWLSITLAYLIGVAALFLLASLVVPQLAGSISMLFGNIPAYVDGLQEALSYAESQYGVPVSNVVGMLDNYENLLTEVYGFISGLTPQIMGYIGNVASNFVAVFTALASSVYMLAEKHRLLHQLHTVTHAVLPPKAARNTLRICRYANENFTGFFVGKIIDSLIIGVLTFVCMTVLRLDYALLISVMVGITNIIPVFGPFIGAVPGLVILLLVDPIQALIFIILILVIQQVDGNIIGPKILGQSVGVSALWVLFAIIVGGDLFGVMGMVVGVPVFATLYGLAQEFVEFLLHKRGIDAEGNPLSPEELSEDETLFD